MDVLILEKIAEVVLNDEGMVEFGELLQKKDIKSAKLYLLGAVDRCYNDGVLLFAEAAEYYSQIGVPPEQASRLRQNQMNKH